jgi:nicotinamide phosphoribosyltransferase
MKLQPLSATDAYKLGHRAMMRNGTTFLSSNFTPRSDRLFKGGPLFDKKMVVFGGQGFASEFLVEAFNEQFFNMPKEQAVARYQRRCDNMMGPGVIPADGFAQLHDLGYLPLLVRALPEGSRVSMKVPTMMINNTHPDFGWLVNYIEPTLSNSNWKSSLNATIAYEYRRVFEHFAELTGTPKEAIQWQGHDFSSRGMSGPEDAARSGAAHLLSFTGTDVVSSIDYVEDYYHADSDNELIGGSVPATEHSISSSNILFHVRALREEMPGMTDEQYLLLGEVRFLLDYITRIVPTGFASYVADTYDYWALLMYVLTEPGVKEAIMARDGRLVIRPDSGNPIEIICGLHVLADEFDSVDAFYKAYDFETAKLSSIGKAQVVRIGDQYRRFDRVDPSRVAVGEVVPEHEVKGSIELLWDIFGGTYSDKGFKQLDSHIGLIYGDSITLERQWEILQRLMDKGFASGNVVLGIGSYTYNYSTRDTFGSAVKATATVIDGEFIELFKDPKTGDALKKSAKGLLRVEKEGDEFVLYDQQPMSDIDNLGAMEILFHNGVVSETSLSEIRQRLID